ncbi:hypothetical protein [Microlunatus soli]|uniref:Uncharacterized protein n=1 Tax=Microlunatus soli TaxID=630515 RepID=A0A1H1TZL8_9ACTN|nr:hypothetical protein [Microlunatus soli]SDS65426.1 hypothetical protein SAMN04489812_2574 [Microlunatus soli]
MITRARLSDRARAVIDDFANHPGVTPDHVGCLRAAIYSSPALAQNFDNAVRGGTLDRLRPLPESSSAGGTYEATHRSISFPLSKLNRANVDEATFVLGHEVQHALNRRETSRADQAFFDDLDRSARHDQDYTRPIARVVRAHRRDEASANIAGWNALADRLRQRHSDLTLEMIRNAARWRSLDFVERDRTTRELRPRGSLVILADGRIDPTPTNVEAMARAYVDRLPEATKLGHNGNSDYANHYGAWAISVAAQKHTTHHPSKPSLSMRVDLEQLHLDRSLLEQNGVDLGQRRQPIPLVDATGHPPTDHLLHHTAASHRFVPIADRPDLNGTSPVPARLARLGFASRPQLRTVTQIAATATRSQWPTSLRTQRVRSDFGARDGP